MLTTIPRQPPASTNPPGAADLYARLDRATRLLAAHPQDTQTRLAAVTLFARLGLFLPALELLESQPELLKREPELCLAVETFRRQPGGRIEWSGRAATFEANLSLARERFATVRRLEERIRQSLAGLELFRCVDGNLLLSRRTASGEREWLPGIVDWRRLALKADELPAGPQTLGPPWLIQGVALGHLVQRAYERTGRMFLDFTPRIHVLEPNLAQLAAWLHAGDWRALLGDERFYLWPGPDGPEELIAFHASRTAEPRPLHVLIQPGWGDGPHDGATRATARLAEAAERQLRQFQEQIRRELAGRSSFAHWARRFAERRRRPLRILGITSRYTTFLQYSMRDIGRAAKAAGHEFELVMEPDRHCGGLPRLYVLERIARWRPDLVLIIDHNRHEYDDAYDLPLPLCNWIQDDLPKLFGPGCGSRLHPYDIVVGVISNQRAEVSGYPREQWRFLPTPVSTLTFSCEPIDESTRRELACDVSFVTNLSITAEEHLAHVLEGVRNAGIRRLLPALHEEIAARVRSGHTPASIPQTLALTCEVARRLGFELDAPAANRIRQIYTERLINIYFRQQVLEWAVELGLDVRIYGRGWERHPRFARYAQGVAEHGPHLRAIYQASRINLQALPSGAVHQRLLEGLASGGFFLIRRTAYDVSGALAASVRERCLALGLQSEEALWDAPDEALRADVRRLNELLYAPQRLYRGFVADQYLIAERGYPLNAGLLLPEYERVSFGTQAEFAQRCAEFLADEQARREIAARQREVVTRLFSYDAALEQLLAFAEQYFSRRAAGEATARQQPAAPGGAQPAGGAGGCRPEGRRTVERAWRDSNPRPSD